MTLLHFPPDPKNKTHYCGKYLWKSTHPPSFVGLALFLTESEGYEIFAPALQYDANNTSAKKLCQSVLYQARIISKYTLPL